MTVKDSDCCAPAKTTSAGWKPRPLFWIAAGLLFLVFLSYFLPTLVPFRHFFFAYLRQIGWMLLLGLVLGGLIERFIPRHYISRLLAKKQKRTVFYSVFLGFLMSACSHGILALAIQLYKKGASTPVVVSFLLASPWANFPITVILFGFFGAKALAIVFAALGIALSTGLIFQALERKHWIESNPNTFIPENSFSIREDIFRRMKGYHFSVSQIKKDTAAVWVGTVQLADMVLGWVLLGIGLSALLAAFIPESFFHQYMGASLKGLFITLGLAAVMEVCSEGTAPMAFEIFRQTGAFGNAFVFLMAGVVTDYTEIGLLWANIGRRTALWMPVVAVPQVVLLGWLANHWH